MPYFPPAGAGAVYAFRLEQSANQSIANATVVTITFDTKLMDIGNGATTGGSANYTVQKDGPYQFAAQLSFAATGIGGDYVIAIKFNGAVVAQSWVNYTPVGNGVLTVSTSWAANIVTTDVLEVTAYQTAGVAVTLFGGTAHNFFEGNLIK